MSITELEVEKIIAQYHGLWVVERAFRISNDLLDTRPIFHFTERRIETHVGICFMAYKLYKRLERIIKMKGINMSAGHVLEMAKTITTIRIRSAENGQLYTKTLLLTDKQRASKTAF